MTYRPCPMCREEGVRLDPNYGSPFDHRVYFGQPFNYAVFRCCKCRASAVMCLYTTPYTELMQRLIDGKFDPTTALVWSNYGSTKRGSVLSAGRLGHMDAGREGKG